MGPVELFGRAMTQWNHGAMGGVTGLRYESLPFLMRMQGIPRSQQSETLDCVQVMEMHAVHLLNRKR